MSRAEPLQVYLDAQADFAARVPAGRESVARIRTRGRDLFAALGFPTTRDEDWKYTSVRPLQQETFNTGSAQLSDAERARLADIVIPGLDAVCAVYVNGGFAHDAGDLEDLPDGAFVGGLGDIPDAYAERIDAVLGRCASADAHGFAALNGAFLHDGACVVLAPGTVVERPIELLYVTAAESEALLAQPRNVILAGAGSRATIVERYVSLNDRSELTNSVTELVAEPGAVIDHYKLQESNASAFHVGGLYIRQQQDSRVRNNNIALGGKLVRNEIRSVLEAPGAHCDLLGLYLASDQQHVDNFTHVDHSAAHCTSREYYRGVLSGRGRAVFRGRVVVHPDAQHTDAEQENKTLLLSPNAEVDAKPQLEIYADEVKCSHGATVGQLDEAAIFYLRSRAIDEKAAKSLLAYAFASEIISRFDLAPLQRRLEQMLPDQLFGAAAAGEVR